MNRNFSRALELVLKHEGGFVNNPKDPGGATNKGVTIGTFRLYVNPKGTVEDLKRITDAQVATVYERQYWNVVRGGDLPDGVDYAVFDFGVNSGPARGKKYLQACVGVEQDSVIGPATLAAVKAADPVKLIDDLCDRRLAFLKGLNTWETFGKGWANRVEDVRSEAKRMASAVPTSSPGPAPAESGNWLAALLSIIAAAFRRAA